MRRKPTPLPKGPGLTTRVVLASAIVGLGCGSSGNPPQAPQAPQPPQAYVDASKDAPAPQPYDAGVAPDASTDSSTADQIAPQPPPQPPQPPPQPPQPPQMPPP